MCVCVSVCLNEDELEKEKEKKPINKALEAIKQFNVFVCMAVSHHWLKDSYHGIPLLFLWTVFL